MNAVVNGIRDFEHTKVGFIQTGSGNDLIKGLGIHADRDRLISSILRNEVVRTCDIGRVTYHNRSSLLDFFTHRRLSDEEQEAALSTGALQRRLFNISAGIGCGYLPRSIVQPYLDSGVMAEYPLDDPYSELDVVFLYRRDHVPDAAFRYFLEQLKKKKN